MDSRLSVHVHSPAAFVCGSNGYRCNGSRRNIRRICARSLGRNDGGNRSGGSQGNNNGPVQPRFSSQAWMPDRGDFAAAALVGGIVDRPRRTFDGYTGDRLVTNIESDLDVDWKDSSAFVSSSTRPVVIILSWMGARRKNINKYIEFYRQSGCDVYFYLNNYRHAVLPGEARKQARRVVDTISTIPRERPVFVHSFSIGTGIYGYVIELMHKNQSKMRNITGVIFDSGPSAIFPRDVAIGLHTMCPKVSKAVWSVFARSLFAVTNARKRFSVAERALQTLQDVKTPQLYMYSLDDKIITKAGESIGKFVESNRIRGIEIFCKVWENSKHATHFRYHPEEYAENLSKFIRRCMEHRASRVLSAIPVAAP